MLSHGVSSGDRRCGCIAARDLVPNALPDVKPAAPRGNCRFSMWCDGEYDSLAWLPLGEGVPRIG
jgi:hypothetical protein